MKNIIEMNWMRRRARNQHVFKVIHMFSLFLRGKVCQGHDLLYRYFCIYEFKGTAQRQVTGVESGTNH